MLLRSFIKSPGFLPAILCFILVSCNKNNDGNAPKARLSITHLVVNAPPLDIFFDGGKMNDQPFSFGSTLQAGNSIYAAVSPGLHTLRVSAGTATYFEKNILLAKDSSYSLIFYDSLLENKIKAMLIQDIQIVDSNWAKARFFHLIPGEDTLKALFTRDAVTFPVSETYLGQMYKNQNHLKKMFILK